MSNKTATKTKAAKQQRIAILSFGGLVKNGAKLIKGKWTNKGTPSLPLEACRVSKSGRLVLAISEQNGVNNQVYAAISKHTNISQALKAFMDAEKIGEKQIGVIDLSSKTASERANKIPNIARAIAQWAKKSNVDCVIWNSLSQKFKDAINIPFSVQAAVNYIQGQPAKVKKLQVEYLKNIPAGIDTPVLSLLKTPAPKAKVKATALKSK